MAKSGKPQDAAIAALSAVEEALNLGVEPAADAATDTGDKAASSVDAGAKLVDKAEGKGQAKTAPGFNFSLPSSRRQDARESAARESAARESAARITPVRRRAPRRRAAPPLRPSRRSPRPERRPMTIGRRSASCARRYRCVPTPPFSATLSCPSPPGRCSGPCSSISTRARFSTTRTPPSSRPSRC